MALLGSAGRVKGTGEGSSGSTSTSDSEYSSDSSSDPESEDSDDADSVVPVREVGPAVADFGPANLMEASLSFLTIGSRSRLHGPSPFSIGGRQ